MGVIALATLAVGCPQEYDFERESVERGTFGEEVVKIVRKDATISARAARERTEALDRDREQIVLAIDTLVPQPWLRPLEELLRVSMPNVDAGILQEVTRRLAEVLGDCEADAELREAWAEPASGARDRVRDPSLRAPLGELVVAYPDLKRLTRWALELLLENDGLTEEGAPDPSESAHVLELVRQLSESMRDVEVTDDRHAVKFQALDVLLSADERLAPQGVGAMWATRLDARGFPIVRINPRTGALYSPFVDRDGDGLADVSEDGWFVDFDGEALTIQAFDEPGAPGLVTRDELGRATHDGALVFDYIDLNQTTMAYLLRESNTFVHQEVFFDLVLSLEAVLPERVEALDENGRAYMGYPEDHPMMDLAWAMLDLGAFDALDEVLGLTTVLLREHDGLLGEMLLSLQVYDDLRDTYPEAGLAEDNTLVDDMMPVIAEIAAEPGLLEELLEVLTEEVMLVHESATIEMLSTKADRAIPAADGPYESCFEDCAELTPGTVERVSCITACPRDEILKEPVDRAAPLSATNRSNLDRTLALLREAEGVPMDVAVIRLRIPDLGSDFDIGPNVLPPLLRFDDVAVAFLESLSGNLDLSRHVTPEALESVEIDLVLDGFDFLCSDSFLSRFLSNLLPRLVRVTRWDLERTCERMVGLDEEELAEEDLKRQKLTVLVVFLSLLTDVPLSETPTVNQLMRFINLEEPTLDLEVAQMELGTLIDADGYRIWEHNGDMLFASEATGMLDALYPIAKVFSDRGKSHLLVRLMAEMSLHYAPAGADYLVRADGTPAPNKGSGIQSYERLLIEWLRKGRLIPTLRQLAQVATELESSRGRPMPEVATELVQRMVIPGDAITHRSGETFSMRPDGERVEPISRFYVMADALNNLSDTLDADPEARASWDSAVEAIGDATLGVKAEGGIGGPAVWAKPGGPAITAILVEHLAERAKAHREDGRLAEVIGGEYVEDMRDAMTGPMLPAVMDLLSGVSSNPEDRQLMTEAMLHVLDDPTGVELLLVEGHRLLADMTRQERFATQARFYGSVLDPEREWASASNGLPMASAGARLVLRTDDYDAEGVFSEIIQNGWTRHPELRDERGDPAGAYPMDVLMDALRHYRRADPSLRAWGDAGVSLSAEDYALICGETRGWLLDDKQGMEQVYDLLDLRKR